MITSMCHRFLLCLLCTQYSRCIHEINRSEKSPAGYLVCGAEQEMISSRSITTPKIARWSNNLAHFKQSSKFAESLKMSEQALEANPENWKALANKADISANKINKLGKHITDEKLLHEIYKIALKDLDAAS